MTPLRPLVLAVALALAAGPALAHPGYSGGGFSAGLAHPWSGADHMLAMVAVGLLAARRAAAGRLLWPAAFLLAMLAGYGLGVAGAGGLPVEPAILTSVIALGGLAASSVRVAPAAGAALIAAFGLCHGLAHGAEAPEEAGVGFALGFALSTAALHGLGLGTAVLRSARPALLRLMGGGVAMGGLVLALVG